MDSLPGQKQAETALDNLAGQGILGSLCVILIISLFFAVRSIMRAKDDRISDQRLMIESLQKINDASKELAIEVNKSTSNLVAESSRNTDSLKSALASQERSLGDLSKLIREQHEDSIKLCVAVNDLRHNRGR